MFKSYSIGAFVGYNDKSQGYEYELIVRDSDFTIETRIILREVITINDVIDIIINIYDSRSLNVSYNLFLFMSYEEELFGMDVQYQIKYYQQHSVKYSQYHEQIEKYFLLK